jgi:hypothetical protein
MACHARSPSPWLALSCRACARTCGRPAELALIVLSRSLLLPSSSSAGKTITLDVESSDSIEAVKQVRATRTVVAPLD